MKRGETTTYHVYPAIYVHNQTGPVRKEYWQIDGVEGAAQSPHPNASYPIPQADAATFNTNQFSQYNRTQANNNNMYQQRYNYDRRQISGGNVGIAAGRYGGKSDYVRFE